MTMSAGRYQSEPGTPCGRQTSTDVRTETVERRPRNWARAVAPGRTQRRFGACCWRRSASSRIKSALTSRRSCHACRRSGCASAG